MSMDYYPAHVSIVSPDDLKRLLPDEYKALETALETHKTTLEEVYSYEYEDNETHEDIDTAITNLSVAFYDKTGLRLNGDFHVAEGRGCEVDGHFWNVEGVWVKSEAAKNCPIPIQDVSYVTFG